MSSEQRRLVDALRARIRKVMFGQRRPDLSIWFDGEFGYVIRVNGLPLDAFNPAVLGNHAGGPHPTFTRFGEQLWAQIREEAERAIAQEFEPWEARKRALMVAVMLSPYAVELAIAERQLKYGFPHDGMAPGSLRRIK